MTKNRTRWIARLLPGPRKKSIQSVQTFKMNQSQHQSRAHAKITLPFPSNPSSQYDLELQLTLTLVVYFSPKDPFVELFSPPLNYRTVSTPIHRLNLNFRSLNKSYKNSNIKSYVAMAPCSPLQLKCVCSPSVEWMGFPPNDIDDHQSLDLIPFKLSN